MRRYETARIRQIPRSRTRRHREHCCKKCCNGRIATNVKWMAQAIEGPTCPQPSRPLESLESFDAARIGRPRIVSNDGDSLSFPGGQNCTPNNNRLPDPRRMAIAAGSVASVSALTLPLAASPTPTRSRT
jgi:hypothetical protein